MLYRHCYIPSFQTKAVPNDFIQLYAEMSTVTSWSILRIHTGEAAIENYNIIDERWPKIVQYRVLIAISRPTGDNWQSKTLGVAISDPRSSIVKRVFDCCISDVETKLFFLTETCKFFLVALFRIVLAMYSVGIYSIKAAIENFNTIDERRSKIVRNIVINCRLSPDCKLFLAALVSDCFSFVFSWPILLLEEGRYAR